MTNHNTTYHCTAVGMEIHKDHSPKHTFERYERKGIAHIQLYGNSYKGKSIQDAPVQQYENNRYSFKQHKVYKLALHGIQNCSPEELRKMSFQDRQLIRYNHIQTQQMINLSKWKVTSMELKSIFTNAFPKLCPWVIKFLDLGTDVEQEDNQVINYSSLKSIGGMDAIIPKLLEMGILPANFYNLKSV